MTDKKAKTDETNERDEKRPPSKVQDLPVRAENDVKGGGGNAGVRANGGEDVRGR